MAKKKASEKKAATPVTVIAAVDPGELAELVESEIESPVTFAPVTNPAEAFQSSGTKRLTGQQLTDLLRQERREKRLADRGY
jgi:hypothetical protein